MPTLYTRKSFLSVEYPLNKADVCFLSIPFDSTTTGPSTSKLGPFCIKEAIKNKEGFDPGMKVNVFKKLKMCDLGEVEVVPGNYELTAERVRYTVKRIREVNPRVVIVTLGGEHLITLPILEAIDEKFDLVQFDAHKDMRKEYIGSKYAHNTWVYHALKLKNCRGITQIGVRSYCEEEAGLKVNRDVKRIKEPVYITFDLDVLDPSIAPSVNNPESNGLFVKDIVNYFKLLCKGRVVGFDIVECCATSPLDITASTAADVLLKFLSYYSKFHC